MVRTTVCVRKTGGGKAPRTIVGTTIQTTTTWALPVAIDRLGAHVKAYVDTLPARETLRLCARFGTGLQCHVNKLPIEMVQMIEGHILDSARMETLPVWSVGLQCFENTCDKWTDHMPTWSADQIHKHNHDKRMYGIKFCHDQCPFVRDKDGRTIEDTLHTYIKRGMEDVWSGSHNENIQWWRKQIGKSRSCKGGSFFQNHEELLKIHFGIGVWFAEHDDVATYGQTYDREMVAYLTFPRDSSHHKSFTWGICTNESRSYEVAARKPVLFNSMPTDESLMRFSRALRLLDLEPLTEDEVEEESFDEEGEWSDEEGTELSMAEEEEEEEEERQEEDNDEDEDEDSTAEHGEEYSEDEAAGTSSSLAQLMVLQRKL